MMNTLKLTTLSIVSFFAPIGLILLLVGVMIGLDTITGVIAAKKRGDKVTSRGLSQVIIKMLIYQLSVITLYILDVALLNDLLDGVLSITFISTKIGGLLISFVELVSIRENIEESLNVSVGDKFKKMVSFIKDFVSEIRGVQNNK